MLLSRFFGRQTVRMTRRPLPNRQPLVEALEGRELLSTFAVISGDHIGANAVVGNHAGTNAVVGNHAGTNSAVGNHIGTPAVVGNHAGTNVV